ncbi:invasion associated locus B family protein [Woodsholea maritima]|uniref:hypothetical protein n=1 Tax=Woodsholea maritima TaxID=240237 RepID=UPI00035D06AD|nr:hypothetical protein [Woodsholea maritima]
MKFSPLGLLAAGSLLLALSCGAQAQEAQFRGDFNDWMVFTRGEGDAMVCYALTRPTDARPGNVEHGDVYFLVSTWKNNSAKEQPNFFAGYTLRPDSPPNVRVGSDRFAMFVSENESFIEEPAQENRLVSAMRRGSDMRVEAVSQRGTATAYTFSLSGVTASLREVERLCE